MKTSPKKLVIVAINLFFGFLHLIIGENYAGHYPLFVNGYMIDILLPLGDYFLMTLVDIAILQSWMVRTALIFGLASGIEIAQAFGIPLFGETFNPVDFAMYGLGVLLAARLDEVIFPRIFTFWKSAESR